MSTPHRSKSEVATIVVAGVIVVAIGLGFWQALRDEKPTTPPASRTEKAEPPPPPSQAAQPAVDLQTLKGKWVRPDGGYILDLVTIGEGGETKATYSNPQPINVSKAQVSRQEGAVKVFIELRDVNYPGSTYDLTYDPQSDSLNGIYYQAALQQRYEVAFVRGE